MTLNKYLVNNTTLLSCGWIDVGNKLRIYGEQLVIHTSVQRTFILTGPDTAAPMTSSSISQCVCVWVCFFSLCDVLSSWHFHFWDCTTFDMDEVLNTRRSDRSTFSFVLPAAKRSKVVFGFFDYFQNQALKRKDWVSRINVTPTIRIHGLRGEVIRASREGVHGLHFKRLAWKELPVCNYFTIGAITGLYGHWEYEWSPICDLPMILIFISSLFSVEPAVAADLWHLSGWTEKAN